MAKKVFRLHEGGTQAASWFNAGQPIHADQIDSIPDGSGATAILPITSIPSPFARLDIFKEALRYVNAHGMDAGSNPTYYHELVSQMWDIAELFFHLDEFRDKIEVIVWNKNNGISSLSECQSPGHKLVADTYSIFLQSGAQQYNFSELSSIYLLNYRKGPATLNIIGGTSPATLFFSAPKDFQYLNGEISFGTHRILQRGEYKALYQRDHEFIKFIWSLSLAIPNFAGILPEVYQYLQLTFSRCPDQLRQELNSLSNASYADNYSQLFVDAPGNNIEILGQSLRGLAVNPDRPGRVSAFRIKPTKSITGKVPLVLPNTPYTGNLKYVDGPWQADYRAPLKDTLPLDQRKLPYQEQYVYPYLTASDFLEDTIIKLPVGIDESAFYTAGYKDPSGSSGFLLPLKPLFFNYFSVEDLLKPGSDLLSIIKAPVGTDVTVRLKIPIECGDSITFTKKYSEIGLMEGLNQDRGIIKTYLFDLSIFPFVKPAPGQAIDYRIMVFDADTNFNDQIKIQLHADASPVQVIQGDASQITNKHDSESRISTISFKKNCFFNNIKIITDGRGTGGILIPKLKENPTGTVNTIRVSIDLGTSNTHVAYQLNGGAVQDFKLHNHVKHLAKRTSTLKTKISDYIPFADAIVDQPDSLFLPEAIGSNDTSFPFRTSLGHFSNLVPTSCFYDCTIPFAFQRAQLSKQLKIRTDLKWGNVGNDGTNALLDKFVQGICHLIRGLSLTENATVSEVVTFFPSSMSFFRRNSLEARWRHHFRSVFSSDANISIRTIVEAMAPYQFFAKTQGIAAFGPPTIILDIGGGTIDTLVVENQVPQFISSAYYGANVLWGDGYNQNQSQNGFIGKYFEQTDIKSLLSDIPKQLLTEALSADPPKSTDIISQIFGLESSITNPELRFSSWIRNDAELKICLIVYYASIIYYTALLIKNKKLPAPRNIIFSGTGSLLVKLLDDNEPQFPILKRLTSSIFCKVLNVTNTNMQLSLSEMPKKITAYGGLYTQQIVEDITSFNGYGFEDFTYSGLFTDPEIENEIFKSTEDLYKNFISDLFTIVDFNETFGISRATIDQAKDVLQSDIYNYYCLGLEEKRDELLQAPEKVVNEALFFFILRGSLPKLANQLWQDKNY